MDARFEGGKAPDDGRGRPLGARAVRLDAVEKVTGKTRYGGDLAPGNDFLVAMVLRSEYPHAELSTIDTSKAAAIDGVVAVYTAKDVPGTNLHGLIRRDMELLATRKVRFTGDAVALVVARTKRAARQALEAIKVEYRPLPGVYSIDDALDPNAALIHDRGNTLGGQKIRKGDALAALANEADVIVEETFTTQCVDHAFLDTEAGVAYMDGDTLTIHASGQWVHEEARILALALGLPIERLRIIQPPTGGAFGGREDLGIQLYLGLAALLTGQKIRLDFTRAESMIARHKRHPIRIRYKLGAKRDGRLVAAVVEVHADEGAYASTGIAVLRKAASHSTGPYRVPNVHVDCVGVFTNHNPTGAMRGFGASQLAIAYEGTMDKLAAALGMDRIELRRRNLIAPGEAVTTTQIVPVVSARECLDRAVAEIGWEGRSYDTDKPWLKRGYGVSVICFGLGYGDGFPDTSRARVRFNDLGRLEVYTGAVEVGQGLLQMCAQLAAEEVGVTLDSVDVISADTKLTPEAGSSSATRQTFFTGTAVRLAATELRHQLLDIGMNLLPIHPDELATAGGFLFESENPSNRVPIADVLAEGRRRGYSLEASSLFQPRTVTQDENGLSPRAFITYLFASHAAEVLVDVETGEVSVQRVVAVHDVGKAINPQLVEGQIEGGVTQGLGMVLMEEVVRREGRMLNANFTDYLLPTPVDVPEIKAVILENPDPAGPFGARGVGEPPLIGTPPAVLGAIYDALGVQLSELPATGERVWRALHEARKAARTPAKT
ncbi:MAG: xanthine dehydrogenase family protein molybdopterin-binding subunit [Candidatus Sericytochromatia bacterium]|nr:xanthine dehydrogenase family protein molybdopterin-binding subunit [Candidatus Tanganyikabacteria bacterium]